jgi:hypothetical protein
MQPIQDDPLVTKLVALQNVLGSDLTEGEKLFLMGIIETYLPKEMLLARGGKTMAALEEIELMWHEKIARQGRLEGQRELLLRQLQVKFGPLPPAVVARIQAITAEAALEKLGEQVLTAESLADITLLEDSEG